MQRFATTLVLVLVSWIGSPAPQAQAAVKPHGLFTDNMVLQQGIQVPVWGKAEAGEKVTVRFQGQEIAATADKDGKWLVRLEKLKAGGPFELTIAGSNTLQLKNVLVGEVWICSGQSNMEWNLQSSADAAKAIAASKNPMLRLFTVPKKAIAAPTDDVQGNWQESGPTTSPGFSGVGYFFGRDLQKALDVPVGLIHTSWGGTVSEAWTSTAALETHPDFKDVGSKLAKSQENYVKAMEAYTGEMAKYKEVVAKAKAEGKQPPPAPKQPGNPIHANTSAALYNGMIAPLIPYGIGGAIWYQGESNAGRAYQYRTLFPTMIKNWRDDWKQGDFPFMLVQLAPFMKISKEPQESAWAELREAQLFSTRVLPKVGMAVITDVGHESDIHPKQKEPVGARLALAALGIGYSKKIVYSGPEYDTMKIEDGKIVLRFKHVGGGLLARGGDLTGFTIAGEDRKFVNAQAKIDGDTIVVSASSVTKPVAVRYGWANFPVVNLENKEGIPATPFRTDDFPILTGPKSK